MFIIAGLGNPGDEYKETRHNTGFIVLDAISGKEKWEESTKANTLYRKEGKGKKEIEFLKPLTFMNNSGHSVLYEATKHKVKPEKIIIIYDDLDLPIGTFKISFDRGDGGHNGLASVIKKLKTRAFVRIRVGVSPVTAKGLAKRPAGEKMIDFLLKRFKDDDLKTIKKVSKKIGEAIQMIVEEGYPKAMTYFN